MSIPEFTKEIKFKQTFQFNGKPLTLMLSITKSDIRTSYVTVLEYGEQTVRWHDKMVEAPHDRIECYLDQLELIRDLLRDMWCPVYGTLVFGRTWLAPEFTGSTACITTASYDIGGVYGAFQSLTLSDCTTRITLDVDKKKVGSLKKLGVRYVKFLENCIDYIRSESAKS